MSDIKLKLLNNGIGSENSIEIDGRNLTNMVSGLSFWQDQVGSPASLELNVFVTSCEVSMQGEVFINDVKVPEVFARAIYDELGKKFGGPDA